MGLLELNAPIVYRSTDQVYEVTQKYYDEDGDETLPVNVYGRTMMAFERVLLLGTRTNTSSRRSWVEVVRCLASSSEGTTTTTAIQDRSSYEVRWYWDFQLHLHSRATERSMVLA
eukprot:scaffold389_cov211-Alexandrium_tamarense.AAC.16